MGIIIKVFNRYPDFEVLPSPFRSRKTSYIQLIIETNPRTHQRGSERERQEFIFKEKRMKCEGQSL